MPLDSGGLVRRGRMVMEEGTADAAHRRGVNRGPVNPRCAANRGPFDCAAAVAAFRLRPT
eukprot:642485-Prymnesium_polylepis.1